MRVFFIVFMTALMLATFSLAGCHDKSDKTTKAGKKNCAVVKPAIEISEDK